MSSNRNLDVAAGCLLGFILGLIVMSLFVVAASHLMLSWR